jgi:MFS family permease
MTSRKPFVVLETATVLSGTANGITMVAFPWLVLDITGDATAAASIAAVSSLPLLVSMLFSGTIVDMVGRRPVAIISDLLSMLSVILVPVLAATAGLDLWLLMTVAVLGAVFDPAGITARETMLPEVARTAGLTLERANGIHESAYGVAFLLGPGIGGLLIGLIGPIATFWATAAAFAASSLLVGLTRIPGGERPPAHQRPRGLWRSTREGLAFIWKDRVLRGVAMLYAVLVAVWLPIESVILPVHFTDLEQPARLGFLITAMSAGDVVGSLAYAAWGARFSRRQAFVGSLILCALPVVGLSLLLAYPVMVGLGFLTGLFFGSVNPIINTAMQNRSPERLRGRVTGIMGSAAYAAGPLGYVLAGPLIEAVGVQRAFLSMALVLLVATLASAGMRSLRGLDDTATYGGVSPAGPLATDAAATDALEANS